MSSSNARARAAASLTAAAVVAGALQFAPLAAAAAEPDVVLTPNPAVTGPAFDGWGTSLVWMANATGAYPADLRDELIETVFGDDGLNLNIARYNIGGGNASDVTDYLRAGGAVPGWWNPDAPLSDADGAITSSYADRDRMLAAWTGDEASDYDFTADAAQLAWVDAIKDRVTKWEAFSNSPPYFMTESGYVSGGFDANAEQIKPEAFGKFATYLKTVAQHVEDAHGISFDTIDPLNEPNTNYWGTTLDGSGTPVGGRQEGAHVGPALQADLLTTLAAELAESDTTTDAAVSGPDETNPGKFVADWDGWTPEAKAVVEQLNVHTYGTGDRLRARDIAKSAGKPLWMSEVEGNWGGNGWNPSSIENGLGIAQHITADLRELDPSAWVLWQPVEDLFNMERQEKLNWGSVFIDFDCNADGDSERRIAAGDADPSCRVATNTKFDTLRNFTHYIEPGDRIVPTNDAQTTSAVKQDGSGAVLVHTNASGDERTVRIDLSGFGDLAPGATVTPIVTTQSPADAPSSAALVEGAPVAVDAGTKSAELTVPAKSVTTFVVSGASGVADAAPAVGDGDEFRLVGVQSGKPLAATNGSPATVLGGSADPDADATQVWTATRLSDGDGTARDRFALRLADGRTLAADANGTTLRQLTDDEARADASAQWIANSTDGRTFTLLNAARERVLDVAGQSTSAGATVGLWTSNGGGNQAFTLLPANEGGDAAFPEATLDDLIEHDFTLYFANSGAVTTDAVDTTDRMGLYQTRSDQAFGTEAATGASWGYVSSPTSNPVRGSSSESVNRTDTLLVDEEPSGANLSNREVAYAFDLPDGEYELTYGIDLPPNWAARTVELRAEGGTLETVTPGEALLERTYPVTVADGRLDVSVHSPAGRTNGYLDPAVSYVVVRASVDWTTEVLEAKLAVSEASDGVEYSPGSLRALEDAREAAQRLVDDASTDAAAIREAYDRLTDAFDLLAEALPPYTSFHPGQEWLDTDGEVIQAHGGQVVPSTDDEGRTIYYLYGEDRTNGYHSAPGVHVYSSYDLYNWTDRGVALRALSSEEQFDEDPYFQELYGDYTQEQRDAVYRDLGTVPVAGVTPPIIERPKVIHNERTGKWVMWAHMDGPSATSTAQYAKATAGVAVADSPFGPFRYIDSYRLHYAPDDAMPPNHAPNNRGMARDMNLFVDDDGTGYIIYSSEENATMFISKLNDEYTDLATPADEAVLGVDYNRITVNEHRESPAIFKHDERYFLITSGTTGWSPNPSRWGTATDLMGTWTNMGDPFPSWASSNSWNSQPSSVIPVDREQGKYIYMGDRWNGGGDLKNAQMVWLPLNMGEGGDTLSVEVHDEWTLDQLDQWAVWDVAGVPASVPMGGAFDVPVVTVTQSGADTQQRVEWTFDGSFDTAGVVTATGTLPDFGGRTFTREIAVVPDHVQYAVNAGGKRTADWEALVAAASDQAPLRNSRPDQAYGVDAGTQAAWGYVGSQSAVAGGEDGTMFSTLRYATEGADLTYRFDGLAPGGYTVYAGYADPWAQWDDRGAEVTVNGVVVEADHDFDAANQTAAYGDVVVGEDGRIEFTLRPTRGPDVQLSWLVIAADEAPVPDTAGPELALATAPGAPDGSAGWYRTPVAIDATATDASGVAAIEYRVDGGSWQPYAAGTLVGTAKRGVEVRATDVLGNVSTGSLALKVDSTPARSGAGKLDLLGLVRIVGVAATDAGGSGVSRIETRVDGGAWRSTTGAAAVVVVGPGKHTVEHRAIDAAGNVETPRKVSIGR
ncbi:glycoside hydrolase [Agromyces sp. LHK192]|uniref:OmpL47-type beta-barrel domain-containing protein n=1 Tax=Agromyces sp. LHK192 TaxID=2498704 RepID=UPI000FD894C5|nr:glycoside hydrolase [Agromyces sp. LHK192]